MIALEENIVRTIHTALVLMLGISQWTLGIAQQALTVVINLKHIVPVYLSSSNTYFKKEEIKAKP